MKKLFYTLLLLSSCKPAYSGGTNNANTEDVVIRIRNNALTTQTEKISVPNNLRSEHELKEIITNTAFYKEILPKGGNISFNLYNSTGRKLQEYLKGAKKDLKLEANEQILIDFKDVITFYDPEEQNQYQVRASLSSTIQSLLQKIKDQPNFKQILKGETIDYYEIFYQYEKNKYMRIYEDTQLWNLKKTTDDIHLKLAPRSTEEHKEHKREETPAPNDGNNNPQNDQPKKRQPPKLASDTQKYIVRGLLGAAFCIILYFLYPKKSTTSKKEANRKKRQAKR